MSRYHIPEIETNRLLLRALNPSDAADMYEYASDAETTYYLSFDAHQSIQDSEYAIREIFMKRPENESPESFAIVLKDSGKMIGTCDFWKVAGDETYEMGYILNKSYWGKGIMSEAARAVLKFAFNDFGVRRMVLRHHADNVGSRKVAIKQGFVYEGTTRRVTKLENRYVDLLIYSILDEEFK
ncbi:GNAT family N-acetyltransferase [Erysipelothrix sp. HDW6C]|uniref:GNAT family N-acetyltransferase n=1 Tax=Erysipelothrix sp. HDW6C TaxID=2714930 RepID=UPI00140AC827|nr:GNAT family protein [Erysipelothrix sp. HDW6C]QIK69900.1 GNAT family N-acetyltransferase [Erysipelothrix sp. HDW6C]